MAIVGFLFAIWLAAKASRVLRVSSMLLEVLIGMILGPTIIGMLPMELSECYHDTITDCDTYKDKAVIANKGYEYCDLGAYMKAGKYTPGLEWNEGFHGNVATVTLDGHTYCINPVTASLNGTGCHRRLSGDNEGKTTFSTYNECLKKSCELDLALKCATTPDIFTLSGHTGVAMMIFESGMHFDFEQAKTVGPWASAVAVIGTFLPLLAGCALAMGYGFDLYPDALAAGVALSPTSIGIALKLLCEAKAMQTYFGQAVMTAAFVDDVLALILFSVLFSLSGDITFLTFLPLILGCIFMGVAIVLAVTFWPHFISWMFSKITETKADAKLTRHDEVMWMLMLFTLCAYAQITHLCGTHLWGCFIAGMCFSTQHRAHHVWVRQVKRYTVWWMRLFFACTLAWSIPVEELFSFEAFWKGSIMGIGPCILTKVCCAPFMGDARWVIGWAMVGRAEFAYFIAIMAKSLKMMEDKLFAILIWSLIYATIFAPLIFRQVLARYLNKFNEQQTEPAKRIFVGAGAASRGSQMLPDFYGEALAEEKRAKDDAQNQKIADLEDSLEKRMMSKQLRDSARDSPDKMEVQSLGGCSSPAEKAAGLPGMLDAQQEPARQVTPIDQMSTEQIEADLSKLNLEEADRLVDMAAKPFITQAIGLGNELLRAREGRAQLKVDLAAKTQQVVDAQRKSSDLQAQLNGMKSAEEVADLQKQLSDANAKCEELSKAKDKSDDDNRVFREACEARQSTLEQEVARLKGETKDRTDTVE